MKRILEIDILRSFATILLLIHHSGIYQFTIGGISLKALLAIQINFILLGIFVLLSGYLLGYSFRQNPNLRLRDYYLKRVTKLYPPYIFALFLFEFLLNVDIKPADIWIHLSGLQLALAPIFSTPVFTLWYFGLLIVYLLVTPFGIKRSENIWQSLAFLSFVFLILTITHDLFGIIDIRIFYYYWVFSSGCLIGLHVNQEPSEKLSKLLLGLAWLIFPITSYRLFKSQAAYLEAIHWGHITLATLFMLSVSFIAYRFAAKIKVAKSVQNIAKFISAGSYFTYMFHRPIWRIIFLLFPTRERSIIFLIQFFIGSPLTLYISSKLQPIFENLRKPSRQAGV